MDSHPKTKTRHPVANGQPKEQDGGTVKGSLPRHWLGERRNSSASTPAAIQEPSAVHTQNLTASSSSSETRVERQFRGLSVKSGPAMAEPGPLPNKSSPKTKNPKMFKRQQSQPSIDDKGSQDVLRCAKKHATKRRKSEGENSWHSMCISSRHVVP